MIGSGSDIWDVADGFHYVYRQVTGNVDIIAHVATQQNTNSWAKSGVMVRESLAAGSRNAFMALTPGNGAPFQRRLATGGVTTGTAGPAVAAPYWVRLVRSNNTITGYVSTNGTAWVPVGSDTVTMATTVFVGLAVTSHTSSAAATSTFDSVSVSGVTANSPPTATLTSPANGSTFAAPATVNLAATATDSDGTVTKVDFYNGSTLIGTDMTSPYVFQWTNVAAGTYTLTAVATDNLGATGTSPAIGISVSGAGGSLPAPWLDQDIGGVPITGAASFAGGTYTVTGSGSDIWGAADIFNYAYKPLAGDGQLVAHVVTQQNSSSWAKAGVMIRETLAGGSTHAMMVVTPGNGSVFQRRQTTGGQSVSTSGPNVTAPYWVRIVRSGNTFSASVSTDGASWVPVGTDTITMASNVFIGLAVTSHTSAASSTATFDNVQ